MKRGVVLAAVSTHNAFFANHTQTYHHYNGTYRKNGHQGLHGGNGTNLHGNVNILLGGAMLAVVATVVFIVCYCCHRNIKRRSESIYRQQWFETDPNMEIFSVEQCFDTPSLYMEQRSDSGVSITSNQNGPPPSYEAVVALDGIRKCSNVNCPLGKTMNIDDDTCGDDVHKSGLTIEDMESPNDDGVLESSDKYYGETKCNEDHLIMCPRCAPPHQSNNNHLCDCNNLIAGIVSSTTPCRNCGELFDAASDANVTNCNQIEGNNKCYYNYMTTPNPNGQIMDEENPMQQSEQSNNVEMLNSVNNNNLMGDGDEVNNNNDSNGLSSATTTTSNDDDNNNNGTVNTTTTAVDLQQINENGIIRLDMSQIIDSTGLPTYEAAIKLEQSGYV